MATAITRLISYALPESAAAASDPREKRATANLVQFARLLVQLGLLFAVIRVFRVETRSFHLLAALAFSGFAVHYWLPFRWKEPFWILLSLASAFVFFYTETAILLIGVGILFFGIARSGLPFRVRAGLIALGGAAAAFVSRSGPPGFPAEFWPMFGSLFMFRMIVYLYDIRHERGKPSLREYLRYFFVLPNYYFLLFPLIDYQTMRRSFYQRDIHDSAQQGITWMTRGVIQLLLYRVIEHWNNSRAPENTTSFAALATCLLLAYLLYLRVSGTFHFIIGLLHLFGYDLPETHRRYLLASSLTDFWRRINVYWKDFMVKIVYFPIYFRLRKRGDLQAQVVATASVFLATWALHSYQFFWLRGEVLFTWPDVLFWGILGALVIVNLIWEIKHPRRKGEHQPRWLGYAQVAGTFSLITVLWSLWQAPTVEYWMDLLTWWK
ncbi:MAG: hypothetical protein KIT09_20600 [Bryobacteraceae bacterium]|nr:hypothetical protein [Bryobacteraceae bacterium]